MGEQAFDALSLTMPTSKRACLWMGRDADKIGGGLVLADEYNVVLGPFAHGCPKGISFKCLTVLSCTPVEKRIRWVTVD